ncbi:MAG: nucleoside 2-deoxyribosyltransferase [Candidatus Pacebacteria bacterium]|nr:nucleoside 2-deoxyribosyltransferase [Candidatus Paceibacterota bacterium]
MKIYFAGSIRGGREDQELYLEFIKILSNFGTVLTEHIGDKSLSNVGETIVSDSYIYERDMQWVRESDVVVAEVSTPSLGVGYEIGQAQSMNKSVLCLRRTTAEKKLSAMLVGNAYIKVAEYSTINDVADILRKFLNTI